MRYEAINYCKYFSINFNFWITVQHIVSVVSIFPDCIILTIPGNPANISAVSCHTGYKDTISREQLARGGASLSYTHQAVTINESFSPQETGNTSFMGLKVVIYNLRLEQFAYRVSNGNQWSEWFHLKTLPLVKTDWDKENMLLVIFPFDTTLPIPKV